MTAIATTTVIPWTHIESCDACGAESCSFRVEADGTTVRSCDLDDFTRAYLVCALWSSTDLDTEEPLDDTCDLDDCSLETLQGAIDDCRSFQECEADDLAESGLDDEQAGHDFWLTRNGHGAGFLDRGLGAVGGRLSKATKPYGSVDLYKGDDGKVYGS
jgi:hypothetical protein